MGRLFVSLSHVGESGRILRPSAPPGSVDRSPHVRRTVGDPWPPRLETGVDEKDGKRFLSQQRPDSRVGTSARRAQHGLSSTRAIRGVVRHPLRIPPHPLHKKAADPQHPPPTPLRPLMAFSLRRDGIEIALFTGLRRDSGSRPGHLCRVTEVHQPRIPVPFTGLFDAPALAPCTSGSSQTARSPVDGTEQPFSSARQPALNDGPKTAGAEEPSNTGPNRRATQELCFRLDHVFKTPVLPGNQIPSEFEVNLPFPNTICCVWLTQVDTRFLRIQLPLG